MKIGCLVLKHNPPKQCNMLKCMFVNNVNRILFNFYIFTNKNTSLNEIIEQVDSYRLYVQKLIFLGITFLTALSYILSHQPVLISLYSYYQLYLCYLFSALNDRPLVPRVLIIYCKSLYFHMVYTVSLLSLIHI